MEKTEKKEQLQVVYVVTCYQNIVGIYADRNDAFSCQGDLISKNRPADVLCRSIIYPLNSK